MRKYFDYLGRKCTDLVTGITGIVESVSFDLYGCVQVVVRPSDMDKDGNPKDGRWLDIKRLVLSDDPPVMEPPKFAGMSAGDEVGPAEKPTRRG